VNLGPESDEVSLEIYGTGIRGRSGQFAVSVTIGNQFAPVSYAGPHGLLVGVDQINVRVPRSLIGAGNVEARVRVDEIEANRSRITIQ
jgi:uncharacterized protein (TIGR03437 family)